MFSHFYGASQIITSFFKQVGSAPRAAMPADEPPALSVEVVNAAEGLFIAEDSDRVNPMLFDETLQKHVRISAVDSFSLCSFSCKLRIVFEEFASTRRLPPAATGRLHVEWLRHCAAVFRRITQGSGTLNDRDMLSAQEQMYSLINRSMFALLQTLANFEAWAVENRYDDGERERQRLADPPPLPDPPVKEDSVPLTYKPDLDVKALLRCVICGACCLCGVVGTTHWSAHDQRCVHAQ